MGTDGETGSDAQRAEAGPPAAIGGYEVLGEVARGGMGIVYRARRADLDRVVALKVVIAGEHAAIETLQRFQREARAAARLSHPNLVEIFDVGQDGPLHYFTMRYVEGESVSALVKRGRLPWRRAAEIARKVALALECAHAQDIVHRDVKPANILVDAEGEPHLADFGLAKDLSGGPFTATGASIGTPAYASPEQVAGDRARIGPRSDVYSLGATLYEMLAGRPPHVGESVFAILTGVLYEDPPLPRALVADLPRDVEAVCVKAIEKDPAQRYATAGEMAEDLARCLAGEPVRAGHASSVSRWARAASRNRGSLVAIGACVLLIAGAAAWLFQWERASSKGMEDALAVARAQEREAARRRETATSTARDAEETLGKAGRVSSVLARWKRLAPALAKLEASGFDSRLSIEEIRHRGDEAWPEVERFARETPDDPVSQATMLALLGWAQRLAGRVEEGLASIRRAQEADADVPYGLLVEALWHFSIYAEDQALPTVTIGSGGLEMGPPRGETLEMTETRKRIMTLLDGAKRARIWGKDAAADLGGALDAVRALQKGDYELAEAGLTQALSSPDLAPFATGLLLARAKVHYLGREFEEALADLDEVLRARPGQAYPHYFLGHVHLGRAATNRVLGQDPREDLTEAIRACDEALTLKPAYDQAAHERGMAWHGLGEAEADRGIDPRGSFAKAIADFELCLGHDSSGAAVWSNLGQAWRDVGDAGVARGEDPRESYAKSIEACDRAVRLDPGRPGPLVCRAGTWFRLGERDADRGVDPLESYGHALEDCTEAIRLDDGAVDARVGRATARLRIGEAKLGLGMDPRETYREAIDDFTQTLGRRPGLPIALTGRAMAWRDLGEAEATLGGDAIESFRKSIADFDASLAANGASPTTTYGRAACLHARGKAEEASGGDPRETYAEASAGFDRALALNSEDASAFAARGETWFDWGNADAARGGEASGRFEKAIRDCGQALQRDPELAYTWMVLGNSCLRLAQTQAGGGVDVGAFVGEAVRDYGEAISRNPRLWQARYNRGQVYEAAGRLEEAVADYEAAVRIVGDADAGLKASLEHARAALAAKGRDPLPEPKK